MKHEMKALAVNNRLVYFAAVCASQAIHFGDLLDLSRFIVSETGVSSWRVNANPKGLACFVFGAASLDASRRQPSANMFRHLFVVAHGMSLLA